MDASQHVLCAVTPAGDTGALQIPGYPGLSRWLTNKLIVCARHKHDPWLDELQAVLSTPSRHAVGKAARQRCHAAGLTMMLSVHPHFYSLA